MRKLQGIPVSPGFTIGKALVLRGEDTFEVPYTPIAEKDIPQEIARFEDAITRTRAEILGIRKKTFLPNGA